MKIIAATRGREKSIRRKIRRRGSEERKGGGGGAIAIAPPVQVAKQNATRSADKILRVGRANVIRPSQILTKRRRSVASKQWGTR